MSRESTDHKIDALIAAQEVKQRLREHFGMCMHGVTAIHDQCSEFGREMVIYVVFSTREAFQKAEKVLPSTVCNGDWKVETHLEEGSHDPDLALAAIAAKVPVFQPQL